MDGVAQSQTRLKRLSSSSSNTKLPHFSDPQYSHLWSRNTAGLRSDQRAELTTKMEYRSQKGFWSIKATHANMRCYEHREEVPRLGEATLGQRAGIFLFPTHSQDSLKCSVLHRELSSCSWAPRVWHLFILPQAFIAPAPNSEPISSPMPLYVPWHQLHPVLQSDLEFILSFW